MTPVSTRTNAANTIPRNLLLISISWFRTANPGDALSWVWGQGDGGGSNLLKSSEWRALPSSLGPTAARSGRETPEGSAHGQGGRRRSVAPATRRAARPARRSALAPSAAARTGQDRRPGSTPWPPRSPPAWPPSNRSNAAHPPTIRSPRSPTAGGRQQGSDAWPEHRTRVALRVPATRARTLERRLTPGRRDPGAPGGGSARVGFRHRRPGRPRYAVCAVRRRRRRAVCLREGGGPPLDYEEIGAPGGSVATGSGAGPDRGRG